MHSIIQIKQDPTRLCLFLYIGKKIRFFLLMNSVRVRNGKYTGGGGSIHLSNGIILMNGNEDLCSKIGT